MNHPSPTDRVALRERALAAEMSPDFWYPVARAGRVRRGTVQRVWLRGDAFALFRTEDGGFHAVEDRCAHRQISLADHGHVHGDHLVCGYHGWEYSSDGRCVGARSHVRGQVSSLGAAGVGIRSLPVRVKYGLVWLFPGDPARAHDDALPAVPRLDQPGRFAHSILVEDFDAHHSLVIENFMDLYHEYLHRLYSPFESSKLRSWEREGEVFRARYDTRFAKGLGVKHFLPGFQPETQVTLSWRYPHLDLDFDGRYALWLFFQPQQAQRTVVYGFFLSAFRVPLLNAPMPYLPARLATKLFTILYSRSFTEQDRVILKGERAALERHGVGGHEVNPLIDPLREFTADMGAPRA